MKQNKNWTPTPEKYEHYITQYADETYMKTHNLLKEDDKLKNFPAPESIYLYRPKDRSVLYARIYLVVSIFFVVFAISCYVYKLINKL
jgi:hypothetical protein